MRLVYLAFGWCGGLVLSASSRPFTPQVWLLMAAVLGVTTAAAWRDPPYRIANLACLLFALGGLRASVLPVSSAVAAFNNTGGLTLEGTVTTAPDLRDDRLNLRITADTLESGALIQPTSGQVLVAAPVTAAVRYGDRVRVTGELIRPAEFDTFSYADYLARDGIFSIMPNAAVETLSGGHGLPLYTALYDLRTEVSRRIARFLPEPQAGLLTGILLGQEQGIAPEIEEAFSKVGAAHVVAISGFNMAVVSGLVTAWLERLTRRKWLIAVCGVGIVMVYTLFVGASGAVVRAAVMSSVLIVGQALKRSTYLPASLAFVALLMSIQQPTILFDVGFQLSFFATLGITLFATPFTKTFNDALSRLFSPAAARVVGPLAGEPLVVSSAALITTLPLTLLYFQRLSPLVLLVNLLIVPVQTWLLLLGGLATIVGFVLPALAQLLFWMDMVLLSWTINVVRFFAALPFVDAEVHLPDELILLYFVMLIGWAVMQATQPRGWLRFVGLVRGRAVLSTICFSGGAIALLMAAVAFSRPDGRLHVWFLDVGHSNAVLVQTPGGAQILIDGGRFPSRLLTALGDRMPFTDRQIDLLIITQPDEFDTGALAQVLERYSTGLVLTNGQPNQTQAALALAEQLADERVVIVQQGYTVTLDDGTFLEVLHPGGTPATDDINTSALALRLRYGDISFFIAGDLSAEGQAALLDAGGWPLATVLHLPQHGTARSLNDDFFRAVQPQLVVIQADPANRRGDPDPDVLASLGDTPVLRTDQQGVIHLLTDGKRLLYRQR